MLLKQRKEIAFKMKKLLAEREYPIYEEVYQECKNEMLEGILDYFKELENASK